MSEIRINIDGQELRGHQGQTILDIARENGIEIPTLCHDDRVKHYGSCGVCVVESSAGRGLLRSCSTYAADGMVLMTDTPRVISTRKSALELMLSDHTGDCRPPCVLACPAQTDCQGYVGLIAAGEYEEALKLVKDKIPLPGSIGRVCPHPCEDACRRELVEEPISIAALKSFLGDKDMENETLLMPEVGRDTGKKIGIIGGGPGGLTAAYFLRQLGHAVEIFDMMPHMGGMLYYGIPEYRLPNDYLTREVNSIRDMGVTFHNNVRIGEDLTLDWMRDNFDAVIVAVGAWSSSGLRAPGEELDGVIGGIDFLRNVVEGGDTLAGKHVAVVGGGNTAMDACRTAVRLGAEKVYNVYRRTRYEMPAEEIEIIEAEEEGVIFKHLTNPIEVLGENGKVASMRIQVMELGEPDASGRRAPVAVEGEEETLELDGVIVAIGQRLDATGLEEIEQTDWGTVSADETTFRTNLDGVFAIGDATNDGADIAISAIGEAKKAVFVIDKYLQGQQVEYKEPYLVTRTVTAEEFADRKKIARAKMPHRTPEDRKENFLEVNFGLSDEAARIEGDRCLECGCHDYFECQLIHYSKEYDVAPEKLEGDKHDRPEDLSHPYIQRDPDKCILCGLCVRICEEVVGSTALGLVNRGFDTLVAPALELPLQDTDCIACGQCVHVCPTGALMEKMQICKQIPFAEESTITTCTFCGVGCQQELTYKGDSLSRALPHNKRPEDALLCLNGRLGFGEIAKLDRLTMPLLKNREGQLIEDTLRQAAILTSKKLQSIATIHGADSVGFAISEHVTQEEAMLIREYATNMIGTDTVFSFGKPEYTLEEVLGTPVSTATLDELDNTDFILLVETDPATPHLITGLRVKRASQRGATVVALNSFDSLADQFASQVVAPGDNLALVQEMLKYILEHSPRAADLANRDVLLKELEDVTVSDTAMDIATQYADANNAIIVFQQHTLSKDAAYALGNLAVASGHDRKPRSGVIALTLGSNTNGLSLLGIPSVKEIDTDSLKALVIFGEDVEGLDTSGLKFLAVQDLTITETAAKADVVFPAKSYAEKDGYVMSSTNQAGKVQKAVQGPVDFSTFELIEALALVLDRPLPYRDMKDVTVAWQEELNRLGMRDATLVPFAVKEMSSSSEEHSTYLLRNNMEAWSKQQGLLVGQKA